MDADSISVTDMRGNTRQYTLPYTHAFNVPRYSTPIVLVNSYETFNEEDTGWSIRNHGNGTMTFFMNGGWGTDRTTITGHVQILGWVGRDTTTGSTQTGRTSLLGVNSRVNTTYTQACGDQSSNGLADSGLHVYESTGTSFPSLVEYWTNDDKDFGGDSTLRFEASRSGRNLQQWYGSVSGDPSSCITWQNTLFQVGK
jgi:hypothetical protein